MWRILHTFRTGGYHFRKQVPIGPYYADMACHHAKLVIEVDGETHGTDAEVKHDTRRDSFLRGEGYTVLRFTNTDVLQNADGVFDVVSGALDGRPKNRRSSATPSPSLPTRGRVPLSGFGTIEPSEPDHTLPLVGTDGEGESPTHHTNRRPST
jgi:very-short-patch-repair endonuclease